MRLAGRPALVFPLVDVYGFARLDRPFTSDVSPQGLPAVGATPLRRFTKWLVAGSADRGFHAGPAVRAGVVLAARVGGRHCFLEWIVNEAARNLLGGRAPPGATTYSDDSPRRALAASWSRSDEISSSTLSRRMASYTASQ